ncbi:MAG: hypothetical protein KBS70_08040, partial [Bacteroidales bacterium]|nr:hypothetical protein [Candidatus Colicola equi]
TSSISVLAKTFVFMCISCYIVCYKRAYPSYLSSYPHHVWSASTDIIVPVSYRYKIGDLVTKSIIY